MKLEVGKYYKTKGGWKAIVVWKCREKSGVYVIHRPGETIGELCQNIESVPIFHYDDGRATTGFSISEPPRYNENHPADLIEEWRE